MKQSSIACVLVSGGLDSAVLLDYALRRHRSVQPIYIRAGLRWERAELFWLKKYLRAVRRNGLRRLKILELPVGDIFSQHWSLTGKNIPAYRSSDTSVYLPGRNILLLSKASVYCAFSKIPTLYIGTLKANPFPDGSRQFRSNLEKALRKGLAFGVRLRAPFARLSKETVKNLGAKLPLDLTFSCLDPRGVRPCHRCNKCAERNMAFSAR